MTEKRLALVVSVLALITILGVAAAGTALAQTTTPPTESTPATPKAERPGRGFWFGFDDRSRDRDTARFDAVAEALDLTPTQLFEELHAGKTLSEIAEAQGVDLSTVQEAISASRVQAMKDRIAQAATDGKITRSRQTGSCRASRRGGRTEARALASMATAAAA